jgi:hypothetical protein
MIFKLNFVIQNLNFFIIFKFKNMFKKPEFLGQEKSMKLGAKRRQRMELSDE